MRWSGLQYDCSLSRAKPLRSCVCLCCVDQGAGSREHHPISHRWFPGSPGQERDPCMEISQSGAGWCAEKPAQDGAPPSLWVGRLGIDFIGVQQSLYLRHLFQCPRDWSDMSSSAKTGQTPLPVPRLVKYLYRCWDWSHTSTSAETGQIALLVLRLVRYLFQFWDWSEPQALFDTSFPF